MDYYESMEYAKRPEVKKQLRKRGLADSEAWILANDTEVIIHNQLKRRVKKLTMHGSVVVEEGGR